MKRIMNCGGYVAPKAKVAALKCDLGFAMSRVEGHSDISGWVINDDYDGADD